MTSHAMKKTRAPISAPVQKAVKAFEAYQRKHSNYGACDTEAGMQFHAIVWAAVNGMNFPVRPDWQLYSYDAEDYQGTDDNGVPYSVKRKRSKEIAQAMTKKARRVYDAIVNGPMSNREALRQYAWRVSF